MALHALAQLTSRILLVNQYSDSQADWQVVRGLAELGMEDRFKYSFKSYVLVAVFAAHILIH